LAIFSNSPIIIFGDHTRAVKWVDSPFVPGADGVKVLKPNALVDSRFFYHQLRNLRLEDKGYARHFKQVRDATYLLPPLQEQKRIAQTLDALLAQVDTIKARIDAIPPLLKRLRSSALSSAIDGHLFGEATADWQTVVIEDLIEDSLIGLVRSAVDQSDDIRGLHPYLKMSNINQDWGFNSEKLVGVKASEEELLRFELRKGDWLFNTRNSIELVGKSCVWRGEPGFLYNNNILRIRFNKRALPDFMEIWFRS
ncbi:hypothetical protein DSI35_22620, partial [Mycobacterium tuberculosis]